MALPRKLKHLNLFNDGNNWQGIIESLTLPKFTRKFEKYRGGSTHCTLSGWKVTKHTLTDVPESLLIGGAPGTNGGEMTRCWDGTLYQCKVYKGLLSDTKINKFIQEGTV